MHRAEVNKPFTAQRSSKAAISKDAYQSNYRNNTLYGIQSGQARLPCTAPSSIRHPDGLLCPTCHCYYRNDGGGHSPAKLDQLTPCRTSSLARSSGESVECRNHSCSKGEVGTGEFQASSAYRRIACYTMSRETEGSCHQESCPTGEEGGNHASM
jgi:hypothetical protein